MLRNALWCAAPSLLLAAIALVPFLDKAFTLDDTYFLLGARHVLVDPLHPTAFDIVWSDVPVRTTLIAPNGPVMAWLLVPSALAGGSETLAHLVQLAAMAVALVATVSLALRLDLSPAWAAASGLLLATTPAVLGMAGTAMPDVPAMAIGVSGLERLVAWSRERRLHQAVLAAALLGLAPLARSHLVLLLGVGALFLAGDDLDVAAWRRIRWTGWLPLAAAPALTAAVAMLTRDPAGSPVDLPRTAWLIGAARHMVPNLVAFLTHWTVVLPLALPWAFLAWRRLPRRWWAFLPAAALSAFLLWRAGERGLGLTRAALAGLGAATLADVLADAWSRRDAKQLALGAWLLVALPVTFYIHLPSKYLVASAPAVAILVARALSDRRASPARSRAPGLVLASTAALGLALGVAILLADAAFAGFARRAAAELIAPRVSAGNRVWFAGHWGFQWYAEKAGGRPLTLTPPYPVRGDLVVTSLMNDPGFAIMDMLEARYPRVTHLARLEDRRPGGRVMSHEVGAGFFSNRWGLLPWGWGRDPLDVIDVWRIE
jgi:4-amino-4-deoxy-L-arabinose transferase-like glycosyltransferase